MKLWKYHEIDKISSIFKLMLHLIWEQTCFPCQLSYFQCILQGQCYVDKIKIDCIQVHVTSNVNIFRYPNTHCIIGCNTWDCGHGIAHPLEGVGLGIWRFHYPAAVPMEFLAHLNNKMFNRCFLQNSRLAKYVERLI